ncbi:MAG TPA: M13 family metallopeptidase [Xanthomonadales bacterium]|nr:M13 family metallopeptidase [Xanthomonadales bacterium]
MKNLIALLALAALIAACKPTVEVETVETVETNSTEPADKVAEATTEELNSGVLTDYIDRNVRPGDDFNLYVNGAWMADAEIPADRASNSVGLEVHERATEDVRVIIEESAEGDFPEGSDEQKVGDLYASYLDMETRNNLGASPLERDFEQIDALENYTDLAVYWAEVNKYGVSLPFTLQQYADFKDPNTYMMYTWQGGLGLPDREYYFDDSERGLEIREKYIAHIESMLDLAGIEDSGEAAAMILALETRIAGEHMFKEDLRDRTALYNKIPLDELTDVMPDFAWQEYLDVAGISHIDGLVVTQLDYTKALNEILTSTSMDDWKTYLKWAVINSSAAVLSEELDKQNFEFYGRTLNGIEQQLPMWKRAVARINGNLGEVVGKVYVSQHFPPEAKERMEELVQNLILAYEQSIKELDWMGEETRAQALDKLSKFTPKIGYPDEWEDYGSLVIYEDDLFGNLRRSSLVNYDKDIARQGDPVDRGEWAMTPQTVNAYYNPPLNEIVFPAAILQPPYFDLSAEDAVNYGAIGAVIGHEIGHGFDDSGSAFDGDGVLRNWWTDEDRAEFERRTARLVDQYASFQPFEDLSVNGEFTLGENIGDLGGLAIALQAYKLSLDGKEAPVIDGFTGVQRVFLGYAQGWRGIMRDEALRERINSDPHAPWQYRVNGVVRNIPEWYEAFNVTEEDDLYLAPEERVKIW